ncbi:hypothetical protein [Streptomyces sp. A012304]|uniref:hypothetical protein n=1 Tax=Streptomyces sp. A012304 TaxID=375446 RepID=UPI00223293ED|nr:hypothetical protein [Streptomyces sp. A012304]GKQ38327.1 hypothetical protein ALMP_48600 [Streptomyces sp. A012304]
MIGGTPLAAHGTGGHDGRAPEAGPTAAAATAAFGQSCAHDLAPSFGQDCAHDVADGGTTWLPEAHHDHPARVTVPCTVTGVVLVRPAVGLPGRRARSHSLPPRPPSRRAGAMSVER